MHQFDNAPVWGDKVPSDILGIEQSGALEAQVITKAQN
jgi:hypothetical protein